MGHAAGFALALTLLATGCSAGSDPAAEPAPASAAPAPASPATPEPSAAPAVVTPPPLLATDGRPRAATMTIPVLGLRDVEVVPYVGTPDDGPGTAIQDGGEMASPRGNGGLVGPGGIGNYLVTGHRTSSSQPFADLPSLRAGARVVVRTRTHRLIYEIVRTRSTSFRQPASLRAQSAAVPGRPGRTATRAMITLSTCATQEDHAVGNYWSDEFHNPEHRIDKVGVLRSVTAR